MCGRAHRETADLNKTEARQKYTSGEKGCLPNVEESSKEGD